MKILSLNSGSSSVKYQVHDWDKRKVLARGIVERVKVGGSFCVHEVTGKPRVRVERECPDHEDAIVLIEEMLVSPKHGVLKDLSEIAAVGHRVVHGGEKFARSVIVTDEILQTFKDLSDLAPLHNPPNVQGIEAARKLMPGIPHVAVMDTAWHQTMHRSQYLYAMPYEWYTEYGIRRYGFHGTSLLYVAKRAAVLLGKKPSECNLISLHVGNGVSANAVKNGRSFDTSMGLTPLEGLVMGTRAGDHDAGIVLYMMGREGYTPDQINAILNNQSGLKGITGRYVDRREIIAEAEKGDDRCQLAIEIETYRLRKYIGAYAAALGKVDAIVWTAGVGEMSPLVRRKAMDGLEIFGVHYDKAKNELARTRNAEMDITAPDSRVKVLVIPTDDEAVFVEDVVKVLNGDHIVEAEYRYSFEDPSYRNEIRDLAFEEECKKNPAMKEVRARIPGTNPAD
ncbi:MAG: acetate kinase [bacterium]|nr:acetate kinase [bacterium]